MGTREFEALGPMLRGVAASPQRCAGDVLLFGRRAAVEALYVAPSEAVAPVDGEEYGARLVGTELLYGALRAQGYEGVPVLMDQALAEAPPGATVALLWAGGGGAPAEVHLLHEGGLAAPEKPAADAVGEVRGAFALRDERHAEVMAAVERLTRPAPKPATKVAPPPPAPGHIDLSGDGPSLVVPAGAPPVAARVGAALEAAGVLTPAEVADAARAEVLRAFAATSSRAAVEPVGEQGRAVAWAAKVRSRLYPSDVVSMAWGPGVRESRASERELPPVGVRARPLYFDAVRAELMDEVERAAPEVERVACFVGAALVSVWTRTGGASGGPALVELEEGARRADVYRAEGSEG